MNIDPSKSPDVLGIQPLSKAMEKLTEGIVDAAKSLFDRICLPAAEEFGLLLKDRVSLWRAQNAAAIAAKAAPYIPSGALVHPRIAHDVIDRGSWVSDEVLQDMWAGLLASSCSKDQSDANILFTTLLDRLTSLQVRILNHICEKAPKWTSKNGLPDADKVVMTVEELFRLTDETDIHRIDRELDHLRSLDLLVGGVFGGGGGFDKESTDAALCPSPLALHLYVKCKGFLGSPVEYWALQPEPKITKGE